MCILAFILSAIIDNLTATIVLITILRKLVVDNEHSNAELAFQSYEKAMSILN